MKRILGILICLFLCVGVTFAQKVIDVTAAQKVSDVTARQVDKQIHITYTLDEPSDISVYLSTDGGVTYSKLLKVSGAVGQSVSPGRNTIVWNVLEEREKFVGDDIVFKVRAEGATVTDIDGNVYKTVKLGNQVWMAENLRTTRYADGTLIPLGTTTSFDVAYRYYPDDNSANVSTYGYLYNWAAVMKGASSSSANPSGVQGICPYGWHVPSDAEWYELEYYVSSQNQYVCGGDEDNIAKALASETGWSISLESSDESCKVAINPSTNNATGFSARPAGGYTGSYNYFGLDATFWSATQYSSFEAYYRKLHYTFAYVARNYNFKPCGYSVRCVRNEEGSGSEGGGDNEDGDDNDTTVTAQACPGTPTVTDVDGNVYNTVQIGEQCWMRENLKTTKYANGTTIPLGTTTSDDVAYRYYPNGNSANVTDYGYLYNWAAVMKGASSSSANPSGVQGICPDGWHVPSDAEWTELKNYVSCQSQYVCGVNTNYIAKALASETGWHSYEEECHVGNDPSANNATGFSARPAGFYHGVYNYFGLDATFWSATQGGSFDAYYRNLHYNLAYVLRYNNFKCCGYSVRCVRNEEGSGSEGGGDNEGGDENPDDNDTTVTAQPCPGAPTVTDVDGNVYNTVLIGEQCWMRENLKTTKYANGTTIPLGTTTSDDVAYRYYPNGNSANVTDYGYLYNWAAVMNGANSSEVNPSGVQGICPNGWHVPSDAEWTELTNYVKSQSQYVCGDNTDYIAKALASEEGWNNYTEICAVGNNPDANNATGFSARPAGYYNSDYLLFSYYACFWSATQYYSSMCYDNGNVDRNYRRKYYGYSVRCVRNEEGSGSEGGGDNEGGDENPDDNDTTVTAQPCPGAPTVTDVDGNVYNTVLIGEQCWMRENLKTTKYANGTTIPLVTETSYDVAYRYYPNNNRANVSTYGYLYNWAAVIKGASSSSANPSGVQGICPNGWHVPSDAEWTELTNYVSSQSQYVCGSEEDYIAKALASETGWISSTNNCAVGNNPSANNATVFSARPAGLCLGAYGLFGDNAAFWSATQYNSDNAYFRYLFYDYAHVGRLSYYKNFGCSVRCVRN